MDPHRLLIAVDDSEATRRAVEYVATVAAPVMRGVVVFHVLPPLPPELLEHGGVSDPDAGRDLAERLRQAREIRREAELSVQAGLFEWARARLEASGIARDAIETCSSSSASAHAVVPEIIAAARARRCRTIAVGRESFSRFRELFRHHICELLIREADGLAVWVIR